MKQIGLLFLILLFRSLLFRIELSAYDGRVWEIKYTTDIDKKKGTLSKISILILTISSYTYKTCFFTQTVSYTKCMFSRSLPYVANTSGPLFFTTSTVHYVKIIFKHESSRNERSSVFDEFFSRGPTVSKQSHPVTYRSIPDLHRDNYTNKKSIRSIFQAKPLC